MRILDGRDSFYQWDLNVKITGDFKVGDEIHFGNRANVKALPVLAYNHDGIVVADVPNILLTRPIAISAYRYVIDDGKYTKEEQCFDVIARPKPEDYIYEDTDIFELQEIVDRAVDNALKDVDFKHPISNGLGENSIVLNGNNAISANSIAFGLRTQAGSKAFRILGYNASNSTYTLDSVDGIEVGDYYSIYFRFRRSKYGKIVNISDKTIKVDSYFMPNISEQEKNEYLPKAYIYIVGKANIGTFVIGENSFATGCDSVASEKESDVGGIDNISDGRYAFTRGYGNITGYLGATFGQSNENLGLKGLVGGQGNYVGSNVESAFIANYLNSVLANYGFAAGIGNDVDVVGQAKFGKYSAPTSALFAVGNGNSQSDRFNAFSVFEDGHAEITSVKEDHYSIINYGYLAPKLEEVDEKLVKKMDSLTNTLGIESVLSIGKDSKVFVKKSAMDGGSANGNTIVRRDESGHLRATSSSNPETNWNRFNKYDAMPRSYIDEKIGEFEELVIELHEYSQNLIGGGK